MEHYVCRETCREQLQRCYHPNTPDSRLHIFYPAWRQAVNMKQTNHGREEETYWEYEWIADMWTEEIRYLISISCITPCSLSPSSSLPLTQSSGSFSSLRLWNVSETNYAVTLLKDHPSLRVQIVSLLLSSRKKGACPTTGTTHCKRVWIYKVECRVSNFLLPFSIFLFRSRYAFSLYLKELLRGHGSPGHSLKVDFLLGTRTVNIR